MATHTITTARSMPERLAEHRVARSAEHKIPKHLHQIWLQGPDAKFEKYRPWQQTWVKNHPQWQYSLWSNKEIEELIATHYAWFLPYYQSYPHWIQRVDVGKYFILHHFGGVYVDMDMRSVRAIDELIQPDDVTFFASANNTGVGGESVVGTVNNCVIGSSAGHHVWDHLFQALLDHHKQKWYHGYDHYIHASTGILRFTAAVLDAQKKANDSTIKVFPTRYFSPVGWIEAQNWAATLQRDFPDSYAIHGYSGTWVSKSGVQWSQLSRSIYKQLQNRWVFTSAAALVALLVVFIAFFFLQGRFVAQL